MLAGFFRGTTAQTAALIDLAWAARGTTGEVAELPMPIADSSALLLPGVRSHTCWQPRRGRRWRPR